MGPVQAAGPLLNFSCGLGSGSRHVSGQAAWQANAGGGWQGAPASRTVAHPVQIRSTGMRMHACMMARGSSAGTGGSGHAGARIGSVWLV